MENNKKGKEDDYHIGCGKPKGYYRIGKTLKENYEEGKKMKLVKGKDQSGHEGYW